jgi:filamentous hemagglutinin family protein
MNQVEKSLGRLFIGGFLVFAISEALSLWLIAPVFPTAAQITPDNTLGGERSRLDSNVLINNVLGDKINGGAIRDRNLFHSFSEFNINDGQRVYFSNPSGVLNILTRVTGGNASSILGTLGVDGAANLFLMNPNGILFGKNASLDVRGSFVGTTANGLQFGNQGFFNATNPQAPTLLTVNPSALTFSQIQANAGITNLSQAPAGVNLTGVDVTGLRVPDGQSLLLVGGDINIDGGSLRAYNGNIELAGLAVPGIVQLNTANNTFSLVVPNDIERSNIFLTNDAEVNVRGSDAGSITINAQNLGLAAGSKLRAGVDTGLGTRQSKAGDITVNATKAITLSDISFIANALQANSFGQGGNINISTGSLALINGSLINATTSGNGDSGNIFIKATDAIFLQNGGIFSNTQVGSFGNGGNINIDAGSISLINGSELNSKTSGQGNAGNISINAQDISVDGEKNQKFSRITSAINPEGVGKSGNIQINTNSLKVTNGAFISSDISGKGDGGDITINARDRISLDGDSEISNSISGQAITKGGDIQITTGSLSLTNGANINTSVLGQGNAGNIIVNARDRIFLDGVVNNAPGGIQSDLLIGGVGKAGNIQIATGTLAIANGAEVSSDIGGRGDAGNITINARDKVTIEGFGGSAAISRVGSTAVGNEGGNVGDISITTGELLLKDGGGIKAFNGGSGKGGNINLNVGNSTTFDGFSAFGLASSADTFTIGSGADAGNIHLKTGSLFLINGGQMNTGIIGAGGNGGKITIVARDRINIDGAPRNIGSFQGQNVDGAISGLKSSLLNGVGRGGDIEITTGSLSVTNGGELSSATNGRGNAGNITINARDTVTFDGTSDTFFSNASSVSLNAVGNSGDIRINAKALFLTNGGEISTFNFGQGNAGNIIINTRDRVVVDGVGKNRLESGINTFASGGNGGNIEITTDDFSLTNGGTLSSFVNRQTGELIKASAGNIAINARNAVMIDGFGNNGRSSRIEAEIAGQTIGTAGDIRIATKSFSLSNGASLNSSTKAPGNAGNINIDAIDRIALSSGSQILATTSSIGKGGNVSLTGGDISFDGIGRDRRSGIFTVVNRTGTGKGGNINVNARNLSITNAAALSSSSFGQGNAGDININSRNVRLDRQGIIAAQTNSSDGGNIKLTADNYLLLRRGGSISTTAGFAQSGGNGGNITLNVPFIVAVPSENSDITANAFTGNGGNINITTQGIFGIEPRAQASDASNDITASSQLGVQGQIAINNPEIDPTKGVIELPNDVVDATTQLSQLCPRGYDVVRKPLGEFIITGHDALPLSPLDPLQGTARIPLATLDGGEKMGRESRQERQETKSSPSSPIIEAQGLVKNSQGEIFLVAQAPKATPSSHSKVSACPQN